MLRRSFIQSTAAAATLLPFSSSAFSSPRRQPVIEKGVAWFNVEDWGVEGRGWEKTKKYFDRLPAKAESKVRAAVWGLSRHSAGMLASFATNSSLIRVRYKVTSKSLAMSHMPATGVSGVDLYGQNEKGEMRWINVSRPSSQSINATLTSNLDSLPNQQARKFQLYLPLYNGVESLEIGVSEKSKFEPIRPRQEKPIVFYGTSIMHGACASRPGMSISSIIGRRLNRPVINLGFSGNGKMEEAVGALICELGPKLIAIDCLPNMNAELVKQRTEKLVDQLRKSLPETPILLVEDRSFTNSPFFKSRRDHHAASRKELRAAYERLQQKKVKHLHYLKGSNLLGLDGEGATDGSHPNDLGMLRYAEAYLSTLQKIL